MKNTPCIFGAVVADLIVELEDLRIEAEGWQIAKDSQFNPGGICITSKMAAVLGAKPKLCGWAGNDVVGSEIISNLQNAAINTEAVITCDSATMMVLAFVNSEGHHSRIVIRNNAYPETMPSEWTAALEDSKIVFLDGYTCIELPEPMVYDLVNLIKQQGKLLVFDPQKAASKMTDDLMHHVIAHTDVLSLNEFEAYWLSTATHGRLAVDNLIQQVKTVFYRRGPQGSELYADGHKYIFAGNNIPAINSLGAGDCYNGALIYGLCNELPLEDIGRMANFVGAVAVTKMETGLGIPSHPEIRDMFQKGGHLDLYEKLFADRQHISDH